MHMVCRTLPSTAAISRLRRLPGAPSGLQGRKRTEVMWGAVCQNLEFPSCGMMSQTSYYCSLFLCISFPLFWWYLSCTLMVLMAKGGLQLNGAHMHQNFRVKKYRNKKIFGVLSEVDFFPSSVKCPAPSYRHVALLIGSSMKKNAILFSFFCVQFASYSA